MNIVDTNVISELTKPHPHAAAIAWLDDNMEDAFVTSISLYEMRHGMQRLPEGKRKASYLSKLSDMRRLFSYRILEFGTAEAEIAGDLHAKAELAGFNPTVEDVMIAAIAIRHNAVLVTRNTKDFSMYGIDLLNPFSDEQDG